ncbi:MAG: hypothetical protein ACREHD_11820 [Pirellulales bacterium]
MTETLDVTTSLLGFVAAALCAMACWRLRDTTLAAPCVWAAASFCALAAFATALFAGGQANRLLAEHLHYLAGITVVAPFIALLGAKRPQHTAWQWVVLSLVALLALQDLRSWLIEASAPSPHPVWRWLLAVIIVMQLCNYLPTRYAAPACLAFAGQFCVLAAYLPLMSECPEWLFSAGVSILSLAVLLTGIVSLRRRKPADTWQATWLDFHDLFGVLWALRVCQRVNAIALEQRSALRLSWHGLSPPHGGTTDRSPVAPDMTDREPLHRALRSVLSRFLSPAWFGEIKR